MTRVIAMVVEEVSVVVEPFPEWLRPPAGGFTVDDLDRLTDLPEHTELIDGALVFMSPQTLFHMQALYLLEHVLRSRIPDGCFVAREMSVVLGKRQRLEPDLSIIRRSAVRGDDDTWYPAEAVVLAVEVVSLESELRDRERKPQLYAEAGIRHLWRVEKVDGLPVVYVYELDPADDEYTAVGIHHGKLQVTAPFPVEVELDLTGL